MSEQQKILLDSEKACIRKTGGVTVQRIPKKWTKRRDLKGFWQGDLEIRLVLDNGQHVIEIRTVPKEEALDETQKES